MHQRVTECEYKLIHVVTSVSSEGRDFLTWMKLELAGAELPAHNQGSVSCDRLGRHIDEVFLVWQMCSQSQ